VPRPARRGPPAPRERKRPRATVTALQTEDAREATSQPQQPGRARTRWRRRRDPATSRDTEQRSKRVGERAARFPGDERYGEVTVVDARTRGVTERTGRERLAAWPCGCGGGATLRVWVRGWVRISSVKKNRERSRPHGETRVFHMFMSSCPRSTCQSVGRKFFRRQMIFNPSLRDKIDRYIDINIDTGV